jgi:hypothetical protein
MSVDQIYFKNIMANYIHFFRRHIMRNIGVSSQEYIVVKGSLVISTSVL